LGLPDFRQSTALWWPSALRPLDLARQPSLEAQVAALADDIAYDNHDIDDGLRAGFLDLDQLLELDFFAAQWRAVEARFHGASHAALLRELVRGQIGLMVNDAIEATRANLAGIGSVGEIRAAPEALAAFSPAMADQERALKRFMYANLYHHKRQAQTAERARSVIARLYAAYHQDARNKATHFVGVPMIVFSLLIPFGWLRADVGGITISAALVISSVLLLYYLAGSTALEAYWKSVAWPQQGVFVGEPLAAPFSRVVKR